jgi:hypothetical protein
MSIFKNLTTFFVENFLTEKYYSYYIMNNKQIGGLENANNMLESIKSKD